MAQPAPGKRPRRIVDRFGDREAAVPPTWPLHISEEVRRQLVQSLVKVVEAERGTGKRARVPGIKVAGKTGTAQNPHGDDHALFAAFAPAAEPEVAIAVVLENIGHGGEFAAPVAGQFRAPTSGRRAGEQDAGEPRGATTLSPIDARRGGGR